MKIHLRYYHAKSLAVLCIAILMLSFTATSGSFYVNDNSTAGDVYTTAAGIDGNAGTASAPFLTISHAIIIAAAGDTIYADAGNYFENITLNKNITLLGANAMISPNTGVRNAESIINSTGGSSIDITSISPVMIKGIKFITTSGNAISSYTSNIKLTLEKNLFDASKGVFFANSDSLLFNDNKFKDLVVPSSGGVFVTGNYNGTTGTYLSAYNNTWTGGQLNNMNLSNVKGDIYENTFSDVQYFGILVARLSSLNITRNTFNNIVNPDAATYPAYGAGVVFYTPAAGMITSITNNYFTNNYNGISVRAGDDLSGTNVHINDNSITGSINTNIYHAGMGQMDAGCNWFGTNTRTIVRSKIIGPVSYIPYLRDGTDNSTATGFQAIANTCNGGLPQYYINDGSSTGDVYTTSAGNDNNLGTSAAPFSTLNHALNIANDGDTIFIDAGTYVTNTAIAINKAIEICGPNRNISAVTGARKAEAIFDFTADTSSNIAHLNISAAAPVKIKGLQIEDNLEFNSGNRRAVDISSDYDHIIQNNLFTRNALVTNSNAHTEESVAITTGAASNILIDNNYFTGSAVDLFKNTSWKREIYINGGEGAIQITNNRFKNARTQINIDLDSNIVISGNDFQLDNTQTTALSWGINSQLYILGANNFSGNGSFINLAAVNPGFIMDATANTYNGILFPNLSLTDEFGLEARIRHGNQATKNGLVRVKPGNVYVVPTSNKKIQLTINFAGNNVVNIGNGTYAENININKPISVLGESQASVIIQPAVSNPNCGSTGGASLCTGASNVALVQSGNVTIQNLTIDGDNPSLTSGVIFGGADIDARNGIITDTSLQPAFNNLTVNNVTVKNIFFRGIEASSQGTFSFNNDSVINVQGTDSSKAFFNNGGAGNFTNNVVTGASQAIVSDFSKGSSYLNNNISNSGSGIQTNNNGGSGGTADLIQNNIISNSTSGGYGIKIFSPFVATTVNANTITNVEVGIANFKQGAAVTPAFTNNTIDAQNKNNSIGIYQSTNGQSVSSANVSGTYQNNFITNNIKGFYLEYESGLTNNITANNNSIIGNTTGVVLAAGAASAGTLTNDFVCNWWGTATDVPAAAGAPVNYSPWLVNGTDNSAAAGFQPVPGSCTATLPISVEYFKGKKQGNTNQLTWKANCNSSSIVFEIERSAESRVFKTIGNIQASKIRCNQPFDFTDGSPLNGINYYRLKMTESDGHISYSEIVFLSNKSAVINLISLMPVLVDKGDAILSISSEVNKTVKIVISDMEGRVLQKQTVNIILGSNTIQMDFSTFSPGSYLLTAYGAEGKLKTIRFVKQ